MIIFSRDHISLHIHVNYQINYINRKFNCIYPSIFHIPQLTPQTILSHSFKTFNYASKYTQVQCINSCTIKYHNQSFSYFSNHHCFQNSQIVYLQENITYFFHGLHEKNLRGHSF